MAFIEGTNGNDTLTGTDDPDHINGLDGDDVVHALGGNDLLRASAGKDTLFGELGDDLLFSILNNDSLDGGPGTDAVTYVSLGFGVGAVVNLEFGTARSSDPNVTGKDTLTSIENIIGSQSADHLQGSTFNNVIFGNGGNDVILGWEGDDSLEGDTGDDTIDGGDGSDTIYGGDFYGSDFLNGNAGFDFLDLSHADESMFVSLQDDVSHTLASASNDVDQVFNFEAVIGSQFADVIIGNVNDNGLQGREGNDTLTGGPGFDTLEGGSEDDLIVWHDGDGNDRIDGGVNFDRLQVEASGNAETFTLQLFFAGPAFVLGIEGAAAGDQAMLIDGVEILDVSGLGGDDKLEVLNDLSATSLTGLIRFSGGVGGDTLDGRAAGNRFIGLGESGNDNLAGGSGVDTLGGGSGSDTLSGGAGADVLNGGGGNDVMTGGAGDDVYIVNSGGDTVSELGGEGIDMIRSTVDTTLGANFERLALLGSDNLVGVGNELANRLLGNSGNNRLAGGGEGDALFGGLGSDTLVGGAGRDILLGGGGNDIFVFSRLTHSGVTNATADQLRDFGTGDKVNVSAIDANASVAGDQAFVLDTGGAFAAGEIKQVAAGSNLRVLLNVDADTAAEMTFLVFGTTTPLADAEFVL